MRKGVVSIVLPIYNVEKYLNRCVKSVTNQSYKNLEIILVDDGSPDNCPILCDEWAKKDNRIKVIHKKNAGLGYARNTGIENATGEYICFFDSDDYIALDTIEKAYNLATKEESDMVVFGFCYVRANGETGKAVIPHTEKTTFSGKEVQNVFLADLIGPDVKNGKQTDLWMSACACLYSLEMIQKASWRFVSEREIISEDVYSLLNLYKFVKRVSVLSEALYFYCENAGSLTHTYKPDRYNRIKNFYVACYQLAEESNYGADVKERLSYPYLSNTIAAMKMIVGSDQSKNDRLKQLENVIKDETLQKVVDKTSLTKEKKLRKLLLEAVRRKQTKFCYLMLKAKK